MDLSDAPIQSLAAREMHRYGHVEMRIPFLDKR
jgi:hypothetical protein